MPVEKAFNAIKTMARDYIRTHKEKDGMLQEATVVDEMISNLSPLQHRRFVLNSAKNIRDLIEYECERREFE